MTSPKRFPKQQIDNAAIKIEIALIRSLKIDDLRALWRKTFKKEVPNALTKDLMARMLIWRCQEQVFGGIDRTTLKTLESHAKGQQVETQRLRRLKPGTELVREYQGERHTVIVMKDGFLWQGIPHKTLSSIANKITGTNWNGYRFFGLRVVEKAPAAEAEFLISETIQMAVDAGDRRS
tara:strand:+ start:14531 stop:15067 length:537 start_codon:yes stop_codon:yes gene_type:complete